MFNIVIKLITNPKEYDTIIIIIIVIGYLGYVLSTLRSWKSRDRYLSTL